MPSANVSRAGEQESWCRLAYWEERTRVGRQLPVSAPAVEVLGHAPRPAPANPAMCLDSLHPLNPKPSQSTLRTREKIGLGKIRVRVDIHSVCTTLLTTLARCLYQ